MSKKHVPPPPIERARASIEMALTRLDQAANTAEPVPIDSASSAALYDLLALAIEDLSEVETAR